MAGNLRASLEVCCQKNVRQVIENAQESRRDRCVFRQDDHSRLTTNMAQLHEKTAVLHNIDAMRHECFRDLVVPDA